MGYKLINLIIVLAVLLFQNICEPDPISNECDTKSVLHKGEFGMCLSNGLDYDIDFFVMDQKGITKGGMKGNTSTIRAKSKKQETIEIQYGDTLYFRAKLMPDLTGLRLNFEDYLKTLNIESEFKNDSVHIRIGVDSTLPGPVSFHFPGHVCSPAKPNCDDT